MLYDIILIASSKMKRPIFQWVVFTGLSEHELQDGDIIQPWSRQVETLSVSVVCIC